MTVIILLIVASLAIALFFLGSFIWAVKSGQFEDTCTPAMRILTDEDNAAQSPARPAPRPNTKPT